MSTMISLKKHPLWGHALWRNVRDNNDRILSLIYDPTSTKMYLLEDISSKVWQLCDGLHSIESIVRLICEEYQVEKTSCEKDIYEFLRQQFESQLLILEDDYGKYPVQPHFVFDQAAADRLNSVGISSHFAGERIIPGKAPQGIVDQHVARYKFSLPYAKDKSVLDLGCGDGYGSHMLSQVARNVIGIDNSNDALALAHGKYALANLSFAQMNATDLRFSNESFDTVCSFEVIEHIEDYDRSLSEIARVLNKNGKLIMSTPNHAMACDRSFVGTPYHVREFYLHEFRECLSEHFGNVEICAQGDYFSNISKFLYLRYGKRFYETTLPQEQFNIEQVTISKENLGSAMVFVAVASK